MSALKNPRREKAAQLRVAGKTQIDAMREAGYQLNGKQRRVDNRASAFFAMPEMRARIAELMAGAATKAEISAARVMEELARIGFANLQSFVDDRGRPIDLNKLPREVAAAIAEIDRITVGKTTRTKLKLHDKLGALEKIGRQLGMFKERVQFTGNLTVTHEDALAEIDTPDADPEAQA